MQRIDGKIVRVVNVPKAWILIKNQMKFFSEYFDVIGISDYGKQNKVIEEREGVRILEVGMKRRFSPLYDIISIIRMAIVLRKEKPDIIHSITPKGGFVSMIAGYIARVPIRIHTFTGLIFPTATGIKRRILIFSDRVICKFSTVIIPEGKGVQEDLLNNKITQKKLTFIGNGNINGVDLEYFRDENVCGLRKEKTKKYFNVAEEDFVFIFIGRIVKDKGVHELVEAFVMFNKVNPESKLLILGDYEKDLDPISNKIERMIETNDSIINCGFQEDIRPFLALSDVFVFPSYREGMPNVLLQAGAMGLPSITTNVNGCNEIIINGYNGVVGSVEDVNYLYDSMIYLFENKDDRVCMSENARSNVENKFEMSFVLNETLKLYNDLLEIHGKSTT